MTRHRGNPAGPATPPTALGAALRSAAGRPRRSRRLRAAACILALLGGVVLGVRPPVTPSASAASLQQPDKQPEQSVTVVDFGFEPPRTVVSLGQTVTFTSDAEHPHTVTDRGGTFDTATITPGDSAQVTFSVAGVYSFFCRINPSSMNGVIVVAPGDQPAQASRVQAHDGVNVDGEQRRFDPGEVTVAPGATVTFANAGGLPHTMTAEDGAFGSGQLAPGPQAGRWAGDHTTFSGPDQVGVYPYVCELFPEMRGVLTVAEPASSRGPPPQDTPAAGVQDGDLAADDIDPAGATARSGMTAGTLLLSVVGALATGLALAALLKRHRRAPRGTPPGS